MRGGTKKRKGAKATATAAPPAAPTSPVASSRRTSEPAHLVCFRVGEETYGIDIFAVREIVRMLDVTRVPGSPDYVLGVINLRGHIVSVVDLGHRLGLGPSRPGRSARILVVDLGGTTVGLLVDSATEVLKLAPDAIEPAPEAMGTGRTDYVLGVGKLEDRLVILIDPARVLEEGELATAAATAGRRE